MQRKMLPSLVNRFVRRLCDSASSGGATCQPKEDDVKETREMCARIVATNPDMKHRNIWDQSYQHGLAKLVVVVVS